MTRRAVLLALAFSVACSDAPRQNVTFDGARAMEYIKAQLDAGARVPGTAAARNVGDWLVKNLKQYADTVIEQRWTYVTATRDSLPLRNIFAQFNPKATRRILYVSHWDSRPHADNSFAVDDRKKPVPGANDGASSTALLMVIAEELKRVPPNVGVDLLFTDGEDWGDFGPPEVDVLLGAKYYADHILPDSTYRPMLAVLWDMIGDRDLRIPQEAHSRQAAQEVVDRVWKTAASLGYKNVFVDQTTYEIDDDHVPLIAKGFKIIDVIDLEFPWHHTTADTIDKVSAQSMEIVGRVAMGVIRSFDK